VLAHVLAPTGPGRAALRNRQLGKIAKRLREDTSAERILVGDLNSTPWSPYYSDLVSVAALKNAAHGFGYHATWPATLRLFGIPIDHCLVSGGLRVRSFRTGRDFGSDHLPLIVDLAPETAGGSGAQ
jgi:endonuclease/exonuclease/phosphatase (EEP) superfamily protein YafD